MQILRSLLFKGQTRNFRHSLVEIRQALGAACNLRPPTSYLYRTFEDHERAALQTNEREFNFLFI